MKKMLMVMLGLLLLTVTLQARDVSTEDKITGLYVAFFNRAADSDGLQNWKNRANQGGDALNTLKEISAGFAGHSIFISTYSSLNNRAFVEAIYRNSLGQDGDESGIVGWINHLESGMSRSDMVANFVNSALTIDLTTENFPNLTIQELQLAQKRQDLLANKVNVAIEFTNRLGDNTNITSGSSVERDQAYLASIDILANVTDDMATVSEKISFLRDIQFDTNPIDRIRNHKNQENKLPIANAGVDISALLNQSIFITGSGSDSDGNIVDYEWKKGSTVLANTASFSYMPTLVGIDILTLTVTDDDGDTSSNSVNITIIDKENQSPVANTGSNQIKKEGESVSLNASGSSDSDGIIVNYEWKEGAIILSSNISFSKNDFTVGSHTIILTITDDDGATDSDTIVITIESDNHLASGWGTATNMPTEKREHASTVYDNKIYVFGGINSGNLVEVYNPQNDNWQSLGDIMPSYRYQFSANTINDKIYLIGYSERVDIFNPQTGAWTEGSSMPSLKSHMIGIAVGTKIYILGDDDALQIYDTVNDSWKNGARMNRNRHRLSSSVVNEKIYAIGGNDNSVEMYDPSTDTWSMKASIPSEINKYDDCYTAVYNNKIYLFGDDSNVAEYDPTADIWTLIDKMFPTPRMQLVAETYGNKIFTIGGFTHNDVSTVEYLEF